MSEDIDIKLAPSAATDTLSKNQQRKLRNDFERDIIRMIETSDVFTCESPTLKQNESRHQEYEVEYPRNHKEHSSLRPNILLQITEFPLLQTKLPKSIASMYAQVADLPHEVTSINCVSLASIAAEKVVAILRRTALEESSQSTHHDDRLIRHVYDLHLMNEHLPEYQEMQDLIDEVIEMDIYQYGDKHPLLKENPRAELLRGLNILISNPIHQERYAQFLGPLVYHPHPATWEEVIENLQEIAQEYLSA